MPHFIAGLVIAGVIVLIILALAAGGMIKRHGALTLLGRFLAGRHLDGMARTDSTFFYPGVRVAHPSGRASRWAHRPGWHRSAFRLGWTAVAGVTTAGLILARTATVITLACLGTLGVTWAGWATVRAGREWNHVRRYVRPLHQSLGPYIGVPLGARPQSWLTIPRGFAGTEGAEIRLTMPEGFLATADAKSAITLAVRDKLGLEDASLNFRTVGKRSFATVSVSCPPPPTAGFEAWRNLVENSPGGQPVIGLGRKAVPVNADFDSESPHVLVSAGTGGGKSTIVRGLVAQELHKGAVSFILDIKRMSHSWAKGMPNVKIARGIEEIHDTLIALKAEVDRRTLLADELANEDGEIPPEKIADIGPRVILVCEEMNATAGRLAAYWRKIKGKDDPTQSPAVEALGDILFMGRAILVNCVAVAQMMTARTLGGPEARENFSTRIMARYTMNAWKMLAPEVWPMPRSSRHLGRMQVVSGGTARETQGLYFTTREARAWGLSGVVAELDLTMPEGAERASVTGSQGAADLAESPGTVPAPPERVTLREAVNSGLLTVSLDSARAARGRDPEFPRTVGIKAGSHAYDPAELARWERNRARAADALDLAQ